MRLNCMHLRVGLGFACMVTASPAWSQQPPPPPAADPDVLQDITVTAQRRAQRLQDVPVAVSSFSNEQVEQTQSTDTLELTRLVPNTVSSNNVGQASANTYYIRGLGQTQSFPTFEPQVGTYVNDIYISRQNANNFALFDLQDVQVLRGPQGTLFGRNSTGGAILVTLAPPGPTFGGFAETSYGDRDQIYGRASVDIPLTPYVLTKTSAFALHDNGYVLDLTTNEQLNYQHNYGVREAVRLVPPGDVVWDFTADFADDDAANLYNFADPHGKRRSVSGFPTSGNLVGVLDGSKADQGQGADVRSYGASSNGLISFDGGTLAIITGYRGVDQKSTVDFPDLQLGPLVPGDTFRTGQFTLASPINSNEYTQEVKWNAQVGRLNYTVGAYYLYETNETNDGAVLNLGLGVPVPLQGETFRNTTSSSAVYAQGDYKITSQLTGTLGLRFTDEVKRINLSPNSSTGFTNIDIQQAGFRTALRTDQFTPRVALAYQFAPDLMGYVSATRGFQGGGWNSLAFTAATFNNFGPESVWSYETGLHYESHARDFRFNVAAFFEDVSNYQLLATSSTPGSFITENAAGLQNYGLEVDASWIPVANLTLTGTLGLQNAYYINPTSAVQVQQAGCRAGRALSNSALVAADCGQGIVTAIGDLAPPQYVPPYTATLGASYVSHFTNFTLTPTAGVQVVGRQSLDTAGSATGIDVPHALLDVGVTYKMNDRPWTLTAECRNCTGENYGTQYLFGYKYLNDPGFYDVRFRTTF